MIAISLGILEHYKLIESAQITEINVKILCPFHEEDSPSCQIELEKECFYCFGCEAKGTLLDFVARLEGMNSLQASIVLSKIARGVKKDSPAYTKISLVREPADDETALEQSRVYFFSLCKPDWDLIANNYMLSRGFTKETLKYFDVRWNPSSDFPVIVPIKEGKQFQGYMSRCLDNRADKYRMSKGMHKNQVLSGTVEAGHPVILVEGKFDQMMCWQNGYDNVVSPLNWSISETQMDKLAGASAIICATDNDRAGYDGYVRIKKMAKVPVVRFPFPSWIHDPAEMSKHEFDAAIWVAERGLN